MEPINLKGLKTIAVIEAAKAALILVAGFGLLTFIHRDLEAIAERIVVWMHLNPGNRLSQIFIRAARHLNNSHLWVLAALTFADAVLRAVEAFGLWFERKWALWLGVVSGAIYIPVEIYELSRGINTLKLGAFLVNVAIVFYLGWSLQLFNVQKEDENGIA